MNGSLQSSDAVKLVNEAGLDTPKSQPSPDLSTDHAEPSLVDVLSSYAEAGFSADAFAVAGGMILCGSCQSTLTPSHIAVYSIRRLEGTSDPSDNLGVVAIICPVCGAQATMVLKYGPEASPDEVTIWQQTTDRRDSVILPADMAPGEKAADGHLETGGTSAQKDMPPPIEFE